MEIHSHRNYYRVTHNRLGQQERCSNELERVAFLKKLVHVGTKQATQTRGKQTIQIKTRPTLKNNNKTTTTKTPLDLKQRLRWFA